MARRATGNQQKHESGNPVQRWLLDRFHGEVVRLLTSVEPLTVLDLGCGEGFVLDEIHRRGIDSRLVGVDMSSTAVSAARDRLGDRATVLEGDVRDLRTAVGRSDVVMMLEVLEHLHDPDSAFELLATLTSSHVLVSVPWEPFFRGLNLLRLKNVRRLGSDPEHVQHWTKRRFERSVSNRFEIVGRGRAFPWTLLLLVPRPDRPPPP